MQDHILAFDNCHTFDTLAIPITYSYQSYANRKKTRERIFVEALL